MLEKITDVKKLGFGGDVLTLCSGINGDVQINLVTCQVTFYKIKNKN